MCQEHQQKRESYYITTPIYYPSDKLHIGHSYTTVAADAMARYQRLRGRRVMFLTGTDEHGQKIQQKAEAAGVTPKAYVDHIVDGIKELWKLFNISYDRFIRTTDANHQATVQAIFQRLYDQGDIYLSEYEGWYCTPCESFWTETQVKDGNCPDCGRPVQKMKESSYFFRLSKYQDRLIAYIESHPDFIQPESRAREMLSNFLKPGLEDLAVSRTSFNWGIEVPFDPKHVIYVWIDALSNYISALGYPEMTDDFRSFWPADVHLVGKEIVRFHSIIWPAILMALDLPLPKQIYGHGWLLFKEGKMSKSKGNVVDPKILCDRYGVDAIRYYLLREIPFGSDGNFSNEALITRINADLANDLGNLLSRSTAMAAKYFGGFVPPVSEREAGPEDGELMTALYALPETVEARMEAFQFNLALTEIWKLVSQANKYIDVTTPWVLAKDASRHGRLAAVIGNLLECLRCFAILLQPFMPETARSMAKALRLPGAEAACLDWEAARGPVGCEPTEALMAAEALFPRLKLEDELAALALAKEGSEKTDEPTTAAEGAENAAGTEAGEKIDFSVFERVKMRAVKVLSCARVKNADRLLLFQLDLGPLGKRQVLSGIAACYEPETLVGKTLILLENLKPRRIRGLLSEGMLLSAERPDGTLTLLTTSDDAPAGSVVG